MTTMMILTMMMLLLSSPASAGKMSSTTKKLLEMARDGEAHAQYSLGVAYLHGIGAEQDSAKADRWFEKAALAGNAAAQCFVGGKHFHGEIETPSLPPSTCITLITSFFVSKARE
jgi:TPR repeat protein